MGRDFPRRDFLKLGVGSLSALALAKAARAGENHSGVHAQPAFRKPDAVDRYVDRLPIPKRLTPEGAGANGPEYRVRMVEFEHPLHSQLKPTRLWGYEGQYPGPTIEARCGKPFVVQWENQLPAHPLFTVDAQLRGAMPPAPEVRAAPLIHGALTGATSGGLPENWFAPGQSARYVYANRQQAGTLWYHDQAAGIARLNVYAGLAGYVLIRDGDEESHGLPSGDYEIPLILQDRTLDDQSQLVYAPTFDDGQRPLRGAWGPQFFGELPVVNGAVYPYLEVEPRVYRLRLLNGSNFRFLNLFFNLAGNAADIPTLVSFRQIGADGGFLPKPAELTKVLLCPAERADLIIDFSGLEGQKVTVSNNAAAPYPGWTTVEPIHRALYEWMQFRVTHAVTAKAAAFSMPTLGKRAVSDDNAPTGSRDFTLAEVVDHRRKSLGVEINGKGYDEPVTESPKRGSLEKWRFINTTDDAHPMHVRRAQMQILERQGFNGVALHGGALELVGKARPAALNEAGWKDTAVVSPGEVLSVLVRFSDEAGRSVFHSALLEQEDKSLMRPFEIVAELSAPKA